MSTVEKNEGGLSCNFTREQINEIEEKIIDISRGETTNVFVSLATGISSAIMSDVRRKPADMESLLGLLNVYMGIIQRTYGVSDRALDIERMKVYQTLSDQIAEYEVRMQAAMEMEGKGDCSHPVETEDEPLKPLEVPSTKESEVEEETEPPVENSAVTDAIKIRESFRAEDAVDVQIN